MGFTHGRGFVAGHSFGLPKTVRIGGVLLFATPRTPSIWQRGFFLVN